ncbi:DUF488 domain-containing protein [Candidatus Methylacidithermus pantelleriae]|uniref:DUF488 domain-containing protein n=1 Tax=Candidatus Methylacidithermus pantelleriae TaxID=2744239 RepID=A0A8J2FWX0_9BACT|nr:conserved hypothetical protein [Candidatus Methylacidithermus pantelleriae]
MIRLKRVYEPPAPEDGKRFLVDRLWPRGIKKGALPLDGWLRDVAPSDALRKWFGHDPAKWEEFQRRYFAELEAKHEAWQPLLEAARKGNVTLLFSARDEAHNNAVALKSFLETQIQYEKLR